ncbi:glycosyltransferase family 4 protein [Tepidamorphus sp. 3E244]|uniref:glycosyltransferase family 4 protein n=1 Tax=Tepidamorphus sp. 3E244 TaxID=3385498 RepID=UPI0038FC7D7D
MRVGFDTAILGGQVTGVGTYTRNLLLAMAQADPKMRFRAFAGLGWRDFDPSGLKDDPASAPTGGGTRSHLRRNTVLRNVWRSARGLTFSKSYARQTIDLYHAFAAVPPATIHGGNGAPSILLIHDVSHIRCPQHHPAERVKWLERLPRDISEAACINTVSEFSRREIADVYDVAAEKIVVTHPGVSQVYRPVPRANSAATLEAYDLKPGQFFLSVGSRESRKNLPAILKAYASLPEALRRTHPLVICGPIGPVGYKLPKGTQELERSGQVRVTGYATARDLSCLYSQAALFLFPSVYEGFGMPLAEALACGARVACSDIEPFHEVAGAHANFIAPDDIDGWSEAMRDAAETAVDSVPVRAERAARGQGFTWDKTAFATIGMYRNVS